MSHLTHGALCNGIAGFALAAKRAGIRTAWTCDIDPFCNAVSRKHFPNAHQYLNIYDVHQPERVDIISAGYPCQPESYAGKRGGTEDNRWLWPEVLRLLAECRPGWFIGENVDGHVTLGLAGVLADLEAEGYEVWPLVLPACAIGAPHRRDRTWIIAHANRAGCRQQHTTTKSTGARFIAWLGNAEAIRHPTSHTSYEHAGFAGSGQESEGQIGAASSWPGWWLTEPTLCAPDDGISSRLVRPDAGGTAAGTGRAKSLEKTWRRSTLHAAGNAIVPQIPELFFQFIADYEAGIIPTTV